MTTKLKHENYSTNVINMGKQMFFKASNLANILQNFNSNAEANWDKARVTSRHLQYQITGLSLGLFAHAIMCNFVWKSQFLWLLLHERRLIVCEDFFRNLFDFLEPLTSKFRSQHRVPIFHETFAPVSLKRDIVSFIDDQQICYGF